MLLKCLKNGFCRKQLKDNQLLRQLSVKSKANVSCQLNFGYLLVVSWPYPLGWVAWDEISDQ